MTGAYIDIVGDGSTLKNNKGTSTLRQSGEPTGRGNNGNSFDYSKPPNASTVTQRVGKRSYNDVFVDDDYGYRHKDTKNKVLTVNLRKVHRPGHGRDGDLSGIEWRTGLKDDDFKHNNIKTRDQNSSYYGDVTIGAAAQFSHITGLPSENPYNAAPGSLYFPGKQVVMDPDPYSTTASRLEPNTVPNVIPAAPSLQNAVGLSAVKNPKMTPGQMAAGARKKFEETVMERRTHK